MKADSHREKCPFKVGDTVVYRPSRRGRDLGAMIHPQPERGRKYKIARIDAEVSVVVEGFENHHAGGIYWTEFSTK
jgi:hypothetical protein